MNAYRPEMAAGLALAIAAAVTLFGAAREGAEPEVAEAASTCQVQQTFTVTRVGTPASQQRLINGDWSVWVFHRLNNVEQPPLKLGVDASGTVFSQVVGETVPGEAGADLTWRYAFYGKATVNPNNPTHGVLFDSGLLPGPEHLSCGKPNLSVAVAVPTPATGVTLLEDPNGDGVVVPFEYWPPATGTWTVSAVSNAGEALNLEVDPFFGTAFATLDYLFAWRITVNRPPNWIQTYPKGASGYVQEAGVTAPPERLFGVHRQAGGG